jgi:hypothetical protein
MADLIFNIQRRYRYDALKQVDTPNGRRYVNAETRLALPSVTTILDKVKNKAKLEEWAQKVGQEEADQRRKNSASIGTAMHLFLEAQIKQRPLKPAVTKQQLLGYRMGANLLDKFHVKLDEVWGNEVGVHFMDKYAGTTDLVGVYNGKPSIIDFKQADKMKKREWLGDYFLQLAAYARAHNWQHVTSIRQGVILMASHDGGLQEFLLLDREFDHYLHAWDFKVAEAGLVAESWDSESHSEKAEKTARTSPEYPAAEASRGRSGQQDSAIKDERQMELPGLDP